jgi:hypothetical protein
MLVSTPPSPSPRYLAYWYQALLQPKGIKLKVEDVTKFKQQLYIARRLCRDPQLWQLSIVVPDTNHLWIVHKDA